MCTKYLSSYSLCSLARQLVYGFFSSCLHVFSSPAIAAGETKEEVCEDFFVLEVQELERAVLDFLYPWIEI